jgi:hypothetical protein
MISGYTDERNELTLEVLPALWGMLVAQYSLKNKE